MLQRPKRGGGDQLRARSLPGFLAAPSRRLIVALAFRALGARTAIGLAFSFCCRACLGLGRALAARLAVWALGRDFEEPVQSALLLRLQMLAEFLGTFTYPILVESFFFDEKIDKPVDVRRFPIELHLVSGCYIWFQE